MSKTASTAVFRAVRQAVPQPVYKIHPRAPASVARAEAHHRQTRQEDLDRAPAALGRFLGLDEDIAFGAENVGADKDYSELYASVLHDVRFPDSTLDLAYCSRCARHSYSDDELAVVRARWRKPTTPDELEQPAG